MAASHQSTTPREDNQNEITAINTASAEGSENAADGSAASHRRNRHVRSSVLRRHTEGADSIPSRTLEETSTSPSSSSSPPIIAGNNNRRHRAAAATANTTPLPADVPGICSDSDFEETPNHNRRRTILSNKKKSAAAKRRITRADIADDSTTTSPKSSLSLLTSEESTKILAKIAKHQTAMAQLQQRLISHGENKCKEYIETKKHQMNKVSAANDSLKLLKIQQTLLHLITAYLQVQMQECTRNVIQARERVTEAVRISDEMHERLVQEQRALALRKLQVTMEDNDVAEKLADNYEAQCQLMNCWTSINITCLVCLQTAKQRCRLRNCNHVICCDCSTQWFDVNAKSTCPVCRSLVHYREIEIIDSPLDAAATTTTNPAAAASFTARTFIFPVNAQYLPPQQVVNNNSSSSNNINNHDDATTMSINMPLPEFQDHLAFLGMFPRTTAVLSATSYSPASPVEMDYQNIQDQDTLGFAETQPFGYYQDQHPNIVQQQRDDDGHGGDNGGDNDVRMNNRSLWPIFNEQMLQTELRKIHDNIDVHVRRQISNSQFRC